MWRENALFLQSQRYNTITDSRGLNDWWILLELIVCVMIRYGYKSFIRMMKASYFVILLCCFCLAVSEYSYTDKCYRFKGPEESFCTFFFLYVTWQSDHTINSILICMEYLIVETTSSFKAWEALVLCHVRTTISNNNYSTWSLVMFSLIAVKLMQDIHARVHANQYGSKSRTKPKRKLL